jgi:hypothetical protein
MSRTVTKEMFEQATATEAEVKAHQESLMQSGAIESTITLEEGQWIVTAVWDDEIVAHPNGKPPRKYP